MNGLAGQSLIKIAFENPQAPLNFKNSQAPLGGGGSPNTNSRIQRDAMVGSGASYAVFSAIGALIGAAKARAGKEWRGAFAGAGTGLTTRLGLGVGSGVGAALGAGGGILASSGEENMLPNTLGGAAIGMPIGGALGLYGGYRGGRALFDGDAFEDPDDKNKDEENA